MPDADDENLPWPHAPPHRLEAAGTYFITAGTYGKAHHFSGAERLAVLQRGLLKCSADFGWVIEAWAVFSNHYHFVARSPGDASSLPQLLGLLHERTAKWVNRLDAAPGRKVWHNYRETHLTFEKSYLARLSYTHRNAVKHGLVKQAEDYPWCSARWLQQHGSASMKKTFYSFKIDQVRVPDEFEPSQDW